MSKPVITQRAPLLGALLAWGLVSCALDQAPTPTLAADDAGDIKHERDAELYDTAQDASPHDVSPEDVSLEDVSSEDVSRQDVSPEDVSGDDVSHQEDVSPEDVSLDVDPPEDVSPDTPDAAVCTPGVEVCDGLDNDCDGQADEGVTRACVNATCSNRDGAQACVQGAWAGECVVPEAPNGVDDDCDGAMDEGVHVTLRAVTWEQLDAARGGDRGCDSAEDNISFCLTASHRWCRDAGFQTGIGVGRHDAQGAEVACLVGQGTADPTWAELSAGAQLGYELTVAAAGSRITWEASHRYCAQALGLPAGVGPLEFRDDRLDVLCLRPWLVRSIDLELPPAICAPDPADGVTTWGSIACGGWVDQACRDRGFEFGYGPIGIDGSVSPPRGLVVCLSDDAATIP